MAAIRTNYLMRQRVMELVYDSYVLFLLAHPGAEMPLSSLIVFADIWFRNYHNHDNKDTAQELSRELQLAERRRDKLLAKLDEEKRTFEAKIAAVDDELKRVKTQAQRTALEARKKTLGNDANSWGEQAGKDKLAENERVEVKRKQLAVVERVETRFPQASGKLKAQRSQIASDQLHDQTIACLGMISVIHTQAAAYGDAHTGRAHARFFLCRWMQELFSDYGKSAEAARFVLDPTKRPVELELLLKDAVETGSKELRREVKEASIPKQIKYLNKLEPERGVRLVGRYVVVDKLLNSLHANADEAKAASEQVLRTWAERDMKAPGLFPSSSVVSKRSMVELNATYKKEEQKTIDKQVPRPLRRALADGFICRERWSKRPRPRWRSRRRNWPSWKRRLLRSDREEKQSEIWINRRSPYAVG